MYPFPQGHLKSRLSLTLLFLLYSCFESEVADGVPLTSYDIYYELTTANHQYYTHNLSRVISTASVNTTSTVLYSNVFQVVATS